MSMFSDADTWRAGNGVCPISAVCSAGAKYDLKEILKSTESTVITECADTSTAIDTIDGFKLFRKKDARMDPNYQIMSDSRKTEKELSISRKYQKYLLMYISQKRNRREK